MFENLVNQEAGESLKSDIQKNLLPGALLFSGAVASGKLTAALEVARVLSCTASPRGIWECNCKACLQSKSLTTSNIMLMGPRDCSLEIALAKDTFLKAVKDNVDYLIGPRYLFIRSVRKLTLRFNDILWRGDSNLNKLGNIIEEINEYLELIDVSRPLPEYEELEKICDKLVTLTLKLENDFLYDSIPINQVRNMEEWAHIKSENGKKTVIIENADRMLAGVRNALLKILEEPPSDCIFILLTSKRNAIMQTILSRVRTYNFIDRSLELQRDVITRVFHNDYFNGSINEYLLTFLPIPPGDIKEQADIFYNAIANRQIPDIPDIVKKCGNFKPGLELRLFLNDLVKNQKHLRTTQQGAEFCYESLAIFRKCVDNITLYNQTPTSSLEILLRDLSTLNVQHGGIMKL